MPTSRPSARAPSASAPAVPPRAGEAQLYSEGTIAFATNKAFELDNAARYGARYLTLAVGSVNAGSEQALADAAARGGLSSG